MINFMCSKCGACFYDANNRNQHEAACQGKMFPPLRDDPGDSCQPVADKFNPDYYKSNGLESINVIESFNLGFCLGNAVKYILRAGKKDSAIDDLKKARWYIDRRITQLERG